MRWTARATWVAVAMLAAAATHAQDVLPPEEAFPYTAEASATEVELRFELPEGYYLYRQRFAFASGTPAVSLGAAAFPPGKIYTDEFFGEMEIYRGSFQIAIPYTRTAAADVLELELGLQGCADIGLCYPPQKWRSTVELPAAPPGALLTTLLKGGATDDALPPEEAFVVSARVDAANELTVSWQIAPGYYLYRDKLAFAAESGIELGAPRLPAGVAKRDEYFGDVAVFYDYVEALVPFARATPQASDVALEVAYQGCKEAGICYPPMRASLPLFVPAASTFENAASAPAAPISEQDRLAALVLSETWWLVLGTFYGLGLLLAFTPCVLPMVPILSGIIAGHGEQVSARRGFALSLAYVLGMAVTYTGAGALAALAGGQVQAAFQKPWIVAAFAGVFVVLGLAMLGAFQMQMPAAIQTRMAALANRQRAGTFLGTAVMGALSALIVTTCVAPPLVATLAVIGQSGDVLRGAGALFALSLGMGSPLLLVGASAGRLLPRVGPWMNAVKAAFGVMMLGMAIWMLERVLPGGATLVLWSLLVFLTGVFLGALEPLLQTASAGQRLGKGLGLLACLYGALMLIGATLGGEDPLRPIPRGVAGGFAGATAQALDFEPIESVAELETALARARSAGAPVMLDFTAEWCVACREMEEYTFPDAEVVAALEPFVLLRADVTDNDAADQALLAYFSSFGPPTIAFFDAAGRAQDAFKLVGFVPADEFRDHVRKVAAL